MLSLTENGHAYGNQMLYLNALCESDVCLFFHPAQFEWVHIKNAFNCEKQLIDIIMGSMWVLVSL